MRICVPIIAAIIFCCHIQAIEDDRYKISEAAIDIIVHGVNSFSKDLYEEGSSKSGNLVISPFSLETALATCFVIVDGALARLLSAQLHLPNNRSQVLTGFRNLLHALEDMKNVTFETNNTMYVQEDTFIYPLIFANTQIYMNFWALTTDFKNNSESSRITVNKWAAEKSRNKIQDLLAPGSFTPGTYMVIGNAIYFEGMWKNPFAKELIFDREFFLSSGSSKKVPMMNIETPLPYAQLYEQDLQVLKLPYQDDKFSMLILLPNKTNGLQELESNYQNLDVHKIMGRLRETHMTVALPRFKMLSNIEGSLIHTTCFGELSEKGANFSGISPFILSYDQAEPDDTNEVNEEENKDGDETGTESAAATRSLASIDSEEELPHEVFIADHPFMYMVVDEERNIIFFMGRVVEPQE